MKNTIINKYLAALLLGLLSIQSLAISHKFYNHPIDLNHVWRPIQLEDLSITYIRGVHFSTSMICLPRTKAVVVKLPTLLNQQNPNLALFIHSITALPLVTIDIADGHLIDNALTNHSVYCFKNSLQHLARWIQHSQSPKPPNGIEISYCHLYEPSDYRNYLPQACPTLKPLPAVTSLDQICGNDAPIVQECVVLKDLQAKFDIVTSPIGKNVFGNTTKRFQTEYRLTFTASNLQFIATEEFQCPRYKLVNCVDLYSKGYQQSISPTSAVGKAAWQTVWQTYTDTTHASFDRWWQQQAGRLITYKTLGSSYPGWLRSKSEINQLQPSSATLFDQTTSCALLPLLKVCILISIL